MTPYIYADSPAVVTSDGRFTGGPPVGAVIQDIRTGVGTYLSDQLGCGFTLLCFDENLAEQLREAFTHETGIDVLIADYTSTIAETYAAQPMSVYLIRPDLHIAARWMNATADAVLAGFQAVTFQEELTS
jgi:3-(3-hydroxy-phenyl)propionate hydroxylase